MAKFGVKPRNVVAPFATECIIMHSLNVMWYCTGSQETVNTPACSVDQTRIDYCNSMLHVMSARSLILIGYNVYRTNWHILFAVALNM